MAQTLNAKLGSTDANAAEGDATLIRSSMVSLGLQTAAVTADMVRDDQLYHEELAKELAVVLKRLMGDEEGKRGLVSLDEIWCLWNRARGVGMSVVPCSSVSGCGLDIMMLPIALVSPRDLALAAPLLPSYTSPAICVTTLKSGLCVLHTARYSAAAFASRALELLDRLESASTLEFSRLEKLSVGLVTEMLEVVEGSRGELVRDDGGREGMRWWKNRPASDWLWSDPNGLRAR
jgi:ESCRT-II complex subunit VPS36